MKYNNICVFCASSDTVPDAYKEAASHLGRLCAERGVEVISGAGFLGLMGAVNDSCLAAGGRVTGIIPQFMVDRGWQHQSLSQLIVTADMASRKEEMRRRSDAIIVLAGGCGTMEELFETATAKQMGFYEKPIVIVNTCGFYDVLQQWMERCLQEEFMRDAHAKLFDIVDTPEQALEYLDNFTD